MNKENKMSEAKIVLGLYENIKILDNKESSESKEYFSRIDTGATKSSLDLVLAAKHNLGPILRTKYVKSAHGNKLRPIIEVEILIAGKKIKGDFTLSDRSHMKYPILIGQNILRQGFIIDPNFERK
ncbi:hypothetical protein GOV05_00555 [Candidatus Woesearchaeota archaeon]|nr:hypothetical protein [Candidatus Woesearchaeota archaeon]